MAEHPQDGPRDENLREIRIDHVPLLLGTRLHVLLLHAFMGPLRSSDGQGLRESPELQIDS